MLFLFDEIKKIFEHKESKIFLIHKKKATNIKMVTSSYGLKCDPSEIFVLHFTLYIVNLFCSHKLARFSGKYAFHFAIQKEFSNKNVFVEKKVRIKFH